MDFSIKQKLPKSQESKSQLASLKFFFFVWITWTFIKFMTLILSTLTNLMLFTFLLFGMLQLNYTYLAFFAFLNLQPIFYTSTHFLDRVFNKSNPFEGSLAINLILIADLLVSFYGIRVTFKSYRVFKAEHLGFAMQGEIDNRETLSSSGETNVAVEPFSGKGVKIGE